MKSKSKVSVTPKGVLEIGNKSSSKYIQIGVSKTKESPSKPCLSVITFVKEAKVNFCSKLSQYDLEVTDIHPLVLRETFEQLNDCDLKSIVLS